MKESIRLRARSRTVMLAALAGTVLGVTAPSVLATTITVDSTVDAANGSGCTLRDAIFAANNNTQVANSACVAGDDNNDTIVFAETIVGTTITLNGTELPGVSSTLVIGQASTDDTDVDNVTIDADKISRIFRNAGNLTLNGLTLINGAGRTGFPNTEPSSGGGAVLNINGGVLTVNGGAMNNNASAISGGGAIQNASQRNADQPVGITLNNVDFSGNEAASDAGSGGAVLGGAGDVVINGGVFNANIAAADGGAIQTDAGLSIQGATFTDNQANGLTADNGGGAILMNGSNNCAPVITDSTFTGNKAGAASDDSTDPSLASGGAIHVINNCPLTVTESLFGSCDMV